MERGVESLGNRKITEFVLKGGGVIYFGEEKGLGVCNKREGGGGISDPSQLLCVNYTFKYI